MRLTTAKHQSQHNDDNQSADAKREILFPVAGGCGCCNFGLGLASDSANNLARKIGERIQTAEKIAV